MSEAHGDGCPSCNELRHEDVSAEGPVGCYPEGMVSPPRANVPWSRSPKARLFVFYSPSHRHHEITHYTVTDFYLLYSFPALFVTLFALPRAISCSLSRLDQHVQKEGTHVCISKSPPNSVSGSRLSKLPTEI